MEKLLRILKHPYTLLVIPVVLIWVALGLLAVVWFTAPWRILEFDAPGFRVADIRVVRGVEGQDALQKLLDRRYRELDEEVGALLARTEPEAWNAQWAWAVTVSRIESDFITLLDEWVEQTGSAAAHLSRAIHLSGLAQRARGSGWWSQVSWWDRFRMRHYHERMYADIEAVQTQGAEYWLTAYLMIDTARYYSARSEAEGWFQEGIRLTPGNPKLYNVWLDLQDPKWGGQQAWLDAVWSEIHEQSHTYPDLMEVWTLWKLKELNNQSRSRCEKLGDYQSVHDVHADAETRLALGIAWYCAHDYERAESYLAQSLATINYRATPWLYRALAAMERGEMKAAALYADVATALAPSYHLAWAARGEVALREQDYALAEAMFRNAAAVEADKYHRYLSFAALARDFRAQPDQPHERIEWTPTGIEIAKETWRQGRRDGPAEYSDKEGRVVSVATHEAGYLKRKETVGPDGSRLIEIFDTGRLHSREVRLPGGEVLESQTLSGFPGRGQVTLKTGSGQVLVAGTHDQGNRHLKFYVPHVDHDGLRMAMIVPQTAVFSAIDEVGPETVSQEARPLLWVALLLDGVELRRYDLSLRFVDPNGRVRWAQPVRPVSTVRFQSGSFWFDPESDRVPGDWQVELWADGSVLLQQTITVVPRSS